MVTLDKDAALALGREITMFIPDIVIMLRRVVVDPRVPQSAKVEAGAALAYLASPKNRLTNMIPVVGQLDDVAIVAFAFRRLVVGAGEPILREHWRGSNRGFQLLIGASSALASPAGAVRKAKLARSLVAAGIERVRGASTGAAGDDPDRIVDGEVLGRGDAVSIEEPRGKGGRRSSFDAGRSGLGRSGGSGRPGGSARGA